ncbi:hypothetical protein ACWX0K_11655 [Nitrobacteraceae bacterium UC4446_H13]
MKLEPEAKAPLELVEPHKIFSLTQEEIAEIHLHHMNVAIEIGCTYNILKMIKDWGNRLENSPNPSIKAEYVKILDMSKRMSEIEERHGAGCLLKLDHPIVACLLAKNPPTFPELEVEAAKRYQTLSVLDLE